MVCVVFLLAYGIAVQSLLYPHTDETLEKILSRIVYHPYLSMFQEFTSHLDELEGMFFMRRHLLLLVFLFMGGF